MFGFITKSRHEREIAEKDYELDCAHEVIGSLHEEIAEISDFEDKFKKAITDLESVTHHNVRLRNSRDDWRETTKLYRPGHEANERRLKRDREQKAAKRAARR